MRIGSEENFGAGSNVLPGWRSRSFVYPRVVKAGLVLDERFEIERIAGRGGAGVVYRGRDRQTDMPVAIKTARTTAVNDPRFAREIATLATLRHPAIVGYLHHGAVVD